MLSIWKSLKFYRLVKSYRQQLIEFAFSLNEPINSFSNQSEPANIEANTKH